MDTNLSNQYVILEINDKTGKLLHTQEVPGALIGQMLVSWGVTAGADSLYKLVVKDNNGEVIDTF